MKIRKIKRNEIIRNNQLSPSPRDAKPWRETRE